MHIPYKGKEYRINNFYEVLISTNVAWMPAVDDVIPSNAIAGGTNINDDPFTFRVLIINND